MNTFTGTTEKTAQGYTYKIYRDGELFKTRKSKTHSYSHAIIAKYNIPGYDWMIESFSGSKELAESNVRAITSPTKVKLATNLAPARFKAENVFIVELTVI